MGAAQAKWKSSGLSDKAADRLQLTPLTGEEAQAELETDKPQPGGLRIPYFDLSGKPTEFFRVRYLEKLPGFAGLIEKPQRYVQKAESINECYLPPLCDWAKIAKDPTCEVAITEGELKAASGCAQGVHTIGLGGVDVWRSSKRGIGLLAPLDEFDWNTRRVTIVFDSDAAEKPGVVRAQLALARALTMKGAKIRLAALPSGPSGEKQGMDDVIVNAGAEALKRCLAEAQEYEEGSALWQMSDEVVYVCDPGFVVVRETGQRVAPGDFTSHRYANRHHNIKIVNGESVKLKRVKTAQEWLQWPGRAEVERLTYAPGQPQEHDGCWNVWPGWGCEPKKGDVSPWKWLLDYMFADDPASRKWFEQWCAYPIQHPGTKLYSACLLWSLAQGTGKTLLAYMLKGIYAKNFIEIKSKALKGGFNTWAENRQFVYGDEITGGQARVDADWLKGVITQHEVTINTKYVAEYTIPDCMNYLFSSNHPDALFMDDADRRYFVHEIKGKPMERAFYERADKWLRGEGPSHLFDHLLRLDLSGFNPREKAPDTEDKLAMISYSRSEVADWVSQLRQDPERLLRPLGETASKECDVYQPAQLLRAFDPEGVKRVTSPGVARELIRNGFRPLNQGRTVRVGTGSLRLYAVRNHDAWARATPKQIASHYDQFFGPGSTKF